jgi:predicted DNA-binding protein
MVNKKTIQLGVRVDKDLMNRLDFFAKQQNVDKMDYVRQAISLFVAEMEKGYEEELIEEYVSARIGEKEFKELMRINSIDLDLKKIRKLNLEKISKKVKGGD